MWVGGCKTQTARYDKDLGIDRFFPEKVMDKSTNEKRQIRMSSVL